MDGIAPYPKRVYQRQCVHLALPQQSSTQSLRRTSPQPLSRWERAQELSAYFARFANRTIRVPLARSCQVKRSRSIHAHQKPSPPSSSETLPTA